MLFVVLSRDLSLCGNLELIHQFKSKSHCKVHFVAFIKKYNVCGRVMFSFVATYNRSYIYGWMCVCVCMMLFQLTGCAGVKDNSI